MSSQAHEEEFDDGPALEPMLGAMGTQMPRDFCCQVSVHALHWELRPLHEFAPASPRAALSGSQSKAPGSAGGYLLRDYEQRIDVSHAMILVAMGGNLLRRNAHP